MQVEYLSEPAWQEKVGGSATPVLVEFVGQTCPVCRQMAPAVERLADKYAGQVAVYRVDVGRELGLAVRYGVKGVPTFKLFCKGEPIAELAGGVYPALLEHLLKHALEHGSECAQKRTKIDYEITGYG